MIGPLLVTAAEASGDLLGGALIRALIRRGIVGPFVGAAGPAMRAAAGPALRSLARVEDLGAAGLIELVPRLPALARTRAALRHCLPDVAGLVTIDAPDLHLPLLARGRRLRLPTVQLVAPQLWAWRASRASRLAATTDRVLCLFKFEVDPLRAASVQAEWVGHPVVERVAATARRQAQARPSRLLLLPGSRSGERARHLRPFLRAAVPLLNAGWEITLSVPPGQPRIALPPGVRTSEDPGLALLAATDLALVAAGTATLEAALLGVPQVVAGALHPLTARVARSLLHTRFVALPNVLLGRSAIVEVLQDLRGDRIAEALLRATNDECREDVAAQIAAELAGVLGPPGFADRAAAAIESVLGGA